MPIEVPFNFVFDGVFNLVVNLVFNKESLRGSASSAFVSACEPTHARLTDPISAHDPIIADPETGGSGRRWRQRVGTTNRPTFHPSAIGVQRFVV